MKTQTLHQLRQQVPEAQKQLYYQHCDRLMAVIYRYTGNTADAEEVLQDSFIQIFEKIDLFDPSKGSFSAWSCRIAINFALMFLRKKRSIVFLEEDLLSVNQWEQNEAISKLAEEDLQEHIASLDEKYAVIFQLKAVEGYSHQEISELLGIKTEASRTIFSRARKQLRRLLTQHKVKYI